jgi:tetratricopeptide (TPR) repeat protein
MHLAQRYEESIPLMLQAIEKDPEFALAYRSLAASLSTQGRSDEARRYIQLALEHSGNSSPKERFWIQIDYYSQSQLTYDKALEACRNWLDLYPDDTQALMLTGRQYLLSEDFELALKYLDASVQNGDVNPWTFYWLALAYNISGAYEKGRQASLLGLRIHPAHSLSEECLFDSYVSQGKIPEAQAWLDKWALKNPGLSTDLKRGDLFILQGGRDEAATILNKYDPAEDSVRRSLLFLSLSEGKIDEAIEMARAGDNHLWLTYLSYRAGRFQEALAESQKALQDALEQGNLRNQAWTLLIRGLVELAMGSMDAAEQTAGELGLCVKAAPIQKIVRYHHFLLGIIERESGRFSDAIDNFTKAIALLPRESWESGLSWECLFFDGLAQTYYKSGDLDRAKETYRKIQSLPFARLRYGDIHARSFYWLGRIAEQKGRKSEATEQYRKFVDLWKDADPGLSEVEDAKKRLVGLKVQ